MLLKSASSALNIMHGELSSKGERRKAGVTFRVTEMMLHQPRDRSS
jgi:hypothetical protein